MVVTDGHVQEAVRTKADDAAVVSAGAAEGMLGGLRLVAHVIDDVDDVGDAREVVIDLHTHQDVGVTTVFAVGALGRGADVDEPVLAELRIDLDAEHTSLTITEQIVPDRGVAAGASHA